MSSTQYGAATLGRQYDSVVDYLGPLALTGTQYGGTQAAHPFDNDNLDNSFRVSNSVKYQSVNYGGFKFGGLYGFSNDAGGFATNRAYSVGTSYNYGPLNVAAGYMQLNNSGATLNSSGAVSDDATFTAGRQRTFGAGISYAFGAAQAGFVLTQTRLDDATGIGASASGTTNGITLTDGSARFTNYEVNGRYNFTPAWSLSGAYTFTDGRIDGVSPKWNQVSVQTAYALSKRTDVYLQGVYQHVSDTGDSGITAAINGLSASSSNSQVAATVGLRHRFQPLSRERERKAARRARGDAPAKTARSDHSDRAVFVKEPQSGTFTAPFVTVIASPAGFAEIGGRFAVVSAGAAPGVPPRGVV
ncbi:porin [Caballeronia humi]|uniref:Porin n=1 Tax=Caballeronia humi TaxID=326474 RepID=A0A158I902_9BURK|nr:porin [Caballeronia humi]